MANQYSNRPQADQITIEARRLKVLDCRRRFLTWEQTAREISEWLGYPTSPGQCAEDLRVLVRHRSAELHEEADSARATMVDQLDTVMAKLAEHANNGSLDHAETLLKFMARKSKLLGTDAPTRIDATVDDRRERLKPEQILERMALIQARLKARAPQELPPGDAIEGQVIHEELDPILRKDKSLILARSPEQEPMEHEDHECRDDHEGE